LLLRLPKTFAAALAFDMATKPLRSSGKPGEETFASILHKGLGSAMCKGFYYPYMTKLWALPPEKLAVTLAHRRVSGNSISKIIGKVLGQIPGLKKPHTGGFYYPKHGFGEISEALKSGAEAKGTEFTLNASVSRIEHDNGRVKAVCWTSDGTEHRRESDVIWSTLPITNLASMMDPPPPAEVMEAVRSIRYRGMILIYLVLEQDQFTEFDAHYFPEIEIPISRLSEPKNYSATNVPKGATVLCAELPCDPGEPLWALSDDELGAKLVEWLNGTKLKVTSKVRMTKTRRLSNAYPVYDRDFERHLDVVYTWIASIKGLLTFGRQGLFAHDNTHHALAMADGAVDCLGPNGTFDDAKWQEYLKVFETHVVED
jgi:protoporphyrinogen oxidase